MARVHMLSTPTTCSWSDLGYVLFFPFISLEVYDLFTTRGRTLLEIPAPCGLSIDGVERWPSFCFVWRHVPSQVSFEEFSVMEFMKWSWHKVGTNFILSLKEKFYRLIMLITNISKSWWLFFIMFISGCIVTQKISGKVKCNNKNKEKKYHILISWDFLVFK